MFKTFPRECGPPRKVVNNIQEWIKYVNTYNGMKKAVYTSIYSFEQIDVKKPIYETANVDKIYFDFDDKSCDAWKECNDLHNELTTQNLKHFIVMSGRGYHLYILTSSSRLSNIKSAIYNAQHNFIDKLKLNVDLQVIGNPAQLARVPNTYNSKGQRFCIPVTKEQFEKGDKFIKELASKQNFISDIVIGENLLDMKQFDYVNDRYAPVVKFNPDDFEDSSNMNYYNDCPNCIKAILGKENIGWKDRYLLIIYFKEKGFMIKEVMTILKNHLSERKFVHCIKDERQLQYLFTRDDLMFPTCEKVMQDGQCPGKCDEINKVLYK